MVGSSFPYSEFLPKEGQARGVQIDIDGRMLSIRYPMEVNLMGDSAETLRALIPFLEAQEGSLVAQGDRKGNIRMVESCSKSARCKMPILSIRSGCSGNCRRVCRTTASSVSDSGSAANWFARDLKIRRGMMASLSGNLATMCPGVPYAIAAKFAFPSAWQSHWSAMARCRCSETMNSSPSVSIGKNGAILG